MFFGQLSWYTGFPNDLNTSLLITVQAFIQAVLLMSVFAYRAFNIVKSKWVSQDTVNTCSISITTHIYQVWNKHESL